MPTIDKAFKDWSDAHSNWSDHTRSLYRARACRRMIDFWEIIHPIHTWTSIAIIAPDAKGSQRRWVRRNLYTLEMAGLVRIRWTYPKKSKKFKTMEFLVLLVPDKVSRKAKQ